MASSVNALLRPRAAQLPWHSLLLVVAGGTALAILVLAQRVEARLALYWALGLGVGLVLQRGRLCFAGAFRDLFLMRNGTMMRAIIVGLALMAPVFALIEARAVPEPSIGAVAGAHRVAADDTRLRWGGRGHLAGARRGLPGLAVVGDSRQRRRAAVRRAHGTSRASAGYAGPTPQVNSLRPAEQRLAAAGGRGRP